MANFFSYSAKFPTQLTTALFIWFSFMTYFCFLLLQKTLGRCQRPPKVGSLRSQVQTEEAAVWSTRTECRWANRCCWTMLYSLKQNYQGFFPTSYPPPPPLPQDFSLEDLAPAALPIQIYWRIKLWVYISSVEVVWKQQWWQRKSGTLKIGMPESFCVVWWQCTMLQGTLLPLKGAIHAIAAQSIQIPLVFIFCCHYWHAATTLLIGNHSLINIITLYNVANTQPLKLHNTSASYFRKACCCVLLLTLYCSHLYQAKPLLHIANSTVTAVCFNTRCSCNIGQSPSHLFQVKPLLCMFLLLNNRHGFKLYTHTLDIRQSYSHLFAVKAPLHSRPTQSSLLQALHVVLCYACIRHQGQSPYFQ